MHTHSPSLFLSLSLPSPPPPPTHTHSSPPQLSLFASSKFHLTDFLQENKKTFVQLFIQHPDDVDDDYNIPSPITTLYTYDTFFQQLNFMVDRVSLGFLGPAHTGSEMTAASSVGGWWEILFCVSFPPRDPCAGNERQTGHMWLVLRVDSELLFSSPLSPFPPPLRPSLTPFCTSLPPSFPPSLPPSLPPSSTTLSRKMLWARTAITGPTQLATTLTLSLHYTSSSESIIAVISVQLDAQSPSMVQWRS